MKTLLLVMVVLVATPASSYPVGVLRNLSAFAISYAGVCKGGDEYFTLPGFPIGSGAMPKVPFVVLGTDLHHGTEDDTGYAVIGSTGPNGDYLSRKIIGNGGGLYQFPTGYGRFINPAEDRINIHSMCGKGGYHTIDATFFYVLERSQTPSDAIAVR